MDAVIPLSFFQRSEWREMGGTSCPSCYRGARGRAGARSPGAAPACQTLDPRAGPVQIGGSNVEEGRRTLPFGRAPVTGDGESEARFRRDDSLIL